MESKHTNIIDMKTVYTYGHGARTLESFKADVDSAKIDLLVDIRLRPQSQYYPHFNKVNLESVFQKRYLFAGESLGGSARFHNDLLEYIKNRGVNKDMSANRLFSLINLDLNKKLFSNLEEFSNDEKRKYWITGAFLNEYIDSKKKQTAIEYLQDLFQRYPNKNICFFCSETNPRHCHRYFLLEKDWLSGSPEVRVTHLEDLKVNQKALF
ncbi:MAG: hypothetical protein A3B13_01020 [Candidatus Liptonbacteria bacterium RIFCSPLOWO2_01_FULL_45_15]|uniref:DUF488 domain-containing protein n=2 Tax=Parcubacteria group TaxID=1794811 RepID=A0A1G2CGR4_9BACT|nr:MAG: hypothetical protein A3B13_01020 [Candidatus Liptonbacteria bacterium RIFCSPLOWO2_01_FULL_45_15]